MKRLNQFYFWVVRKPMVVAWLVFFIFTAVVALLLQLVVLPYLFPELHAGHGLLVGGDWVGFHRIAVELAEKMHVQGWSAWELRPHGHSAAGIAAAIYAISVSEPYMIIPLSAALHATAGVALMRIARYLTDDDFVAFCAALPFVLYPSALAWYAQINKNGFYFAGAFLCLYGWILLARLPSWKSGYWPVMAGLIWISVGLALMGLVRIYSYQMMQAMGFIIAVSLTMLFIVRGVKKELPWKTCIAAIVIMFLVPLSLHYAPVEMRGSAVMALNNVDAQEAAVTTTDVQEITTSSVDNMSNSVVAQPVKFDRSWLGPRFAQDYWQPSGWLPVWLENFFLRISTLREGYLSSPDILIADRIKPGSMIDSNIHLLSVDDVLTYIPRAAQIGFLSPFPEHWVAKGVSPGSSIMRRVAGMEMVGVYSALLFLPYALWHWRSRVEMWLPVVFGTILVMLYGVTTPNIGTLYRLRYGFLMLLVSIGLVGMITVYRNFRKTSL